MSIPNFDNFNNNKNQQPPFLNAQAFKNISQCPLCRRRYNPLKASILEESEDAYLVHIHCPNCQSSLLVLILHQGPVISSMGLVTDLNQDDLRQLKDSRSLVEDDVLAVHQLNSIDFINN